MEQTNRLKAVPTAEKKSHTGFSVAAVASAANKFGKLMGMIAGMLLFTQPAFAAPEENTTTTIWTKANEIMKDVYSQILLISTIAAVVTASVALLMMNFSRSGRTVDESRAWLKRICITWAVLNGLGFIMAYITPFFADGKWNG